MFRHILSQLPITSSLLIFGAMLVSRPATAEGKNIIIDADTVISAFSDIDATTYGGNAGGLKAGNRTDVSLFDPNNDRSLRGFVYFLPTAAQRAAVLGGALTTLDFTLTDIEDATPDLGNLDIHFVGRGNLIVGDAWNFPVGHTFSNALTPSSTPGNYSLNVSEIASAPGVGNAYWLFRFQAQGGTHEHGVVSESELYFFESALTSNTLTIHSAPEPSTLVLAAMSICGLGLVRRRRRG